MYIFLIYRDSSKSVNLVVQWLEYSLIEQLIYMIINI